MKGEVVTLEIVLVVVALLLVVLITFGYNRLIRRLNHTKNAWAQVEVQLAKRHDLIPALVQVVKGYAAHERQTLDSVTDARTVAVNARGPAAKATAEDTLTSAMDRVIAVAEAYPQLKASDNFLKLQDDLSSVESGLAYARQYYNDAVLSYENARQTLPTMPVAALFRFRRLEYFKATPGAVSPVAVSLQ